MAERKDQWQRDGLSRVPSFQAKRAQRYCRFLPDIVRSEQVLIELARRHLRASARRTLALSMRGARESLDLINPAFWRNHKSLEQFRGRHVGERCVIIGNGPSLRRTNLDLLKGEVTFGLNRIYLMSPDLPFQPTYYVCVNDLVLQQCASQIRDIPGMKFLPWHQRRRFRDDNGTHFVRLLRGPWFGTEPGHGVWGGGTVTYVALQLAYFMGFETVILVGVDHRFTMEGAPNREVVSQEQDTNHFHPEYFGPGFRWNLPDLKTSELAYRLAKAHFESAGRRVLDGTVDGELKVFEKIDLGYAIKEKANV